MATLFIFHRDLRIVDNTALNEVSKKYDKIFPVFIFDPRQILPHANPFYSGNAVRFMCESLIELQKALPELRIFYGNPKHIVRDLVVQNKVASISFNYDFTVFSKVRDGEFAKILQTESFQDYALQDVFPETAVGTTHSSEYVMFTPFYNAVDWKAIRHPTTAKMRDQFQPVKHKGLYEIDPEEIISLIHPKYLAPEVECVGGRSQALKHLKDAETVIGHYSEDDLESSKLSAYLKFGCVSVREVYKFAKEISGHDKMEFIRQLIWRDFYYNVAVAYPKTVNYKTHKNKSFKGLRGTPNPKWNYSEHVWANFIRGKTGIDIIDAGIAQLLTTGFIHNRIRMILATYLTRDLGYDWRLGEAFFAKYLTDYDPCVNAGNWQYIAGVGTAHTLNVLNVDRQAKKYDPKKTYRNRWLVSD